MLSPRVIMNSFRLPSYSYGEDTAIDTKLADQRRQLRELVREYLPGLIAQKLAAAKEGEKVWIDLFSILACLPAGDPRRQLAWAGIAWLQVYRNIFAEYLQQHALPQGYEALAPYHYEVLMEEHQTLKDRTFIGLVIHRLPLGQPPVWQDGKAVFHTVVAAAFTSVILWKLLLPYVNP